MPNLWTTQINPPEDIIEFLQIWQRVSNIIINLSHDLWRYISDDWFVQANRKGQVGSSTMAQKINPTNDENAAGNFKKMNGLAWVFAVELPESRLQRDLEDSTVMRELGQIMSYCLIGLVNIEKGLKEISLNEKVIETALNRDWAILSEAVQLMLRKKTNLRDPYTLVKTFFRGREQTTAEDYHNWIKSLKIDDQTKTDLLDLTPEKYLGLAATLTKKLLEEVEPMLMLD
jgi:adenylosuccinate lyase